MTRILVTGASGLLGSNLILEAHQAGHTVVASARTRSIDHAGIAWMPAELTDSVAVAHLLDSVEPDWVIHCAAATDVDRCEEEPEWAYSLNRDAARQVAAAARTANARLVHISTDAVFDGEGGPYSEAEVARPVNAYGQSKLAGEAAVSEAHPEALIVRTNFYGWSPRGRASLAEWYLNGLRDGDPIRGFKDVWVSPLLANDLAKFVLGLLETGEAGIFHIGAGSCMSKYEFGLQLAQTFRLDGRGIRPASVDVFGLRAPRPKRLCLAIEKIERTLSVQMPTVEEGLEQLKALDVSGYRKKVYELVTQPREVPG
ncbi:MAG: SDR family oxidoreductase [Anaerolineales bacterium]